MSQAEAIGILGFLGIIAIVVGGVLWSDGNRRLGRPLLTLGMLSIAPAFVVLWIKAIGG